MNAPSSKKPLPGKVASDQAAALEKRDLEATEASRRAAEQARAEAEAARAQVDEKVKTYVEQIRDLEDPSDEEDAAFRKLSEIYARAAARSGTMPQVAQSDVMISPGSPELDGPVTARPTKPDTEPRMERIVIAEDHADISEVLAEVLKDEGYSVRVAGDGVEALEKVLKGSPPDVLILDMGLPYLDGRGVIAALQTTRLANMPILIISAALAEKLPQEIRDRYVFIPKSAQLTSTLKEELLKIVAQRVAEWRAQGRSR